MPLAHGRRPQGPGVGSTENDGQDVVASHGWHCGDNSHHGTDEPVTKHHALLCHLTLSLLSWWEMLATGCFDGFTFPMSLSGIPELKRQNRQCEAGEREGLGTPSLHHHNSLTLGRSTDRTSCRLSKFYSNYKILKNKQYSFPDFSL